MIHVSSNLNKKQLSIPDLKIKNLYCVLNVGINFRGLGKNHNLHFNSSPHRFYLFTHT